MEGEEQRGVLDAWPGSATRLFKVRTQAYQKAFSASPCLGLSPSRLPGTSSNRCSHVTDVGKLRPREEVVLAHTLSMYHYPSPFI